MQKRDLLSGEEGENSMQKPVSKNKFISIQLDSDTNKKTRRTGKP